MGRSGYDVTGIQKKTIDVALMPPPPRRKADAGAKAASLSLETAEAPKCRLLTAPPQGPARRR